MFRGEVYAAILPHIGEEKFFVIVSNNSRNRKLDSVLGLRITSKPKQDDLAIIIIPNGETHLQGRVLCDDINEIFPEDITRLITRFSPSFMQKINQGLRESLDLW
jgi:mRNA interferase MazF